MTPILDLEWSKVDIKRSTVRTVDNHRTKDTFPSLNGEMRVIPRCSVVFSPPCVGHGRARCDWALRNRWNTIVHIVVQLTDTVEMDGSTVVLEEIVDLYDNGITPAGLDCRTWHLAVDQHDKTLDSIRGSGGVGDIELICYNLTSDWSELVPVGVDVIPTELVSTWLAFTWCTVGEGACGQSWGSQAG